MSSKKGSARSKGSFFVCFLIMLSTRCRWWYDDEKRRMLELRCKCKLRYQIEFLQSLPDRNMYVSFWAVHTHHKKILHLFQWKYLHKMWWYYWNLLCFICLIIFYCNEPLVMKKPQHLFITKIDFRVTLDIFQRRNEVHCIVSYKSLSNDRLLFHSSWLA